ncbi:WYL domain-containing protein [Microbacterium hominis]|uniref:WYL domain-containing protein n=1 Tax=Microbacterium hominis TaxID=162426 RepID=A0A7D4PPT3_9MICO|nr:WYL domain-containing protein [Microbacterium hominis]
MTATDQGLTKETILASVAGYREQAGAGVGKDALEKMFERDKENLRRLGVPIETIGDSADPDDLREARYRVPTAEYELPVDISFTPAELALLTLAGGVWSESSMSEDARSGVRKIRALGIAVDQPIQGFAPRIAVNEAAFDPLNRAIERLQVVVFPYLMPGGTAPRTRHLKPLALLEYEGRWHVYGYDIDMEADRTFLLSRIVGPVRTTRTAFDAALVEGAGARALRGLAQLAQRQSALLEVDPGTEAALRLGRRSAPADQGIRVPYVDAHIFADELASYGPEVRVVEPATLRDLVVTRLEAAAAANARTEGDAA